MHASAFRRFMIQLQVQPNPRLEGVVADGADVLPASMIQESFDGQCGHIVNFGLFGQSLRSLDNWYQDHGLFGQVCAHVDLVSATS